MDKQIKITGLTDLVEEQLSEVAFVQDYVEFHFDGKILRSLAAPIIKLKEEIFTFPGPGSRDALCSLIGRDVEAVRINERDSIVIDCGERMTITIPLSQSARNGPEAAHFVSGENQPIEIW